MVNENVRPGELDDWADIPDFLRMEGTLLLGNGASRAVWDDFGYRSLYEEACWRVQHPLTPESRAFFGSLDNTTNFEQVLRLLSGAQRVVTGLKMVDHEEIKNCRENVRAALIEAVHAVHLPWNDAILPNLDAIQAELLNYSEIFTTNYDLIPYWCLMRGNGPDLFKDFFQAGGVFNPSPTAYPRTSIYYLHGALHLYKTRAKRTRKRVNFDGHNILSRFNESFENDNTPLFVSEGRTEDKVKSIEDSDYLRFAIQALKDASKPLVIFGQSLAPDLDQHLIDALRPNDFREVAISVLRDTPTKVTELQNNLMGRLPAWNLRFFDSTTHPLGSAERKVTKT